jgi:hypothetical protein
MWGRLYGDDANTDFTPGTRETLSEEEYDANTRFIRNQSFRNDIKELSVSFMLDLKKNNRTFISRPDLVPYLTAGIAVFHHNPKAQVPDRNYVDFARGNQEGVISTGGDPDYNGVSPGDWVELRPLQTEGVEYSSFAIAIPLGVGLRYKLNRYFDLSFEVNYRQTFTDYIDDVSTFYRDLDELYPENSPSDNLGRIMAYRSNELLADENRDEYSAFISRTTDDTGVSPINNRPYEMYTGYGYDNDREGIAFIRGKSDNDVYLVANFTVTYIIGTSVRNAKFR